MEEADSEHTNKETNAMVSGGGDCTDGNTQANATGTWLYDHWKFHA